MTRIAVGGLHMECSTYNPVIATERDFRILRGDALIADPYFSWLNDYDAEILPTMHARAIAGGPVARQTYEAFKAEILDRFSEFGPLEGIYLAMHGAMFVEGMEDAEGDFIAAVRQLAGDACPIAASYDLHGNVSQRVVDNLDMFSTYRTAPHIDVEQTMRRAMAMLLKSLKEGARPRLTWMPSPVLLPGERTSTEDEPAKSFYAAIPDLENAEGIWDVSFQVGYVWADEPRATAAAVVTGTDADLAKKIASRLAQDYWDLRESFVFGSRVGSIEECVSAAINSATHPVVIADSGDNPTGGGVGDRVDLLRALVLSGAGGVIFAGLADRPATDRAYERGEGGQIPVSLGGTLDRSSLPFTADALVVRLRDTGDPAEREAVLRLGGILLVISSKRRPFHHISDFLALGLDPLAAKIIAVKSGYLSPELAAIANPGIMALSPGVVDQYVERLPRLRKTRLTYPFDRNFQFRPSSG